MLYTYLGAVVVELTAHRELLNFAVSVLLHQFALTSLRSSFTLDGEIDGFAEFFLCTVENTLAHISRLYGADLAGEQGTIGIANKICRARKLIQNLLLGSNSYAASSNQTKEENRCGHYR